jgi:dihydroneopterin aldolase
MSSGKKLSTLRMINMTFYGYHGASAAEKETGRRFEVDCEFKLDITRAAKTDSLENTVNYTKVYDIIEDIIQNNRYNLMETLAERMADAVFDEFKMDYLKLRVRKRIPPVPGNIDYLEVESERVK